MSQHTKGPWTVAYYATQDGQGGTSHYSVKFGSKTIVKTDNQVSDSYDEANARLISAAPDLLSALREIVAEWDTTDRNDTGGIVLARQAIAKAEGQEPHP